MEEKEINKKIAEMVLKALDEGWSAKLRQLATLLNKRAEFEETLSELNRAAPNDT